MGLFDIFSSKNSDKAAADRIAGLNDAYGKATTSLNAGASTANDYYGKALVPFTQLFGAGSRGVDSYSDALGLNGPEGNARATAAFQNNPGYQTQLQYGTQAIDRGAASRGRLSSGNTVMAEQKFGNDLASTGYQNYLNSFSPFFNLAGTGAQGVGAVNTTAAGTNYDAGKTGASLGWNLGTGIGDANASADLAKNQASANMWGALMSGLGLATGVAGFKPAGTLAGKATGWG